MACKLSIEVVNAYVCGAQCLMSDIRCMRLSGSATIN